LRVVHLSFFIRKPSLTKTWTIVELIRWTTEYLTGKGISGARLTTELLLSGVLGLKRLDLYLQYDRPLAPEELAEFKARLQRRARREPLQYIEGRAAFRDLLLHVDRRVLIPRPETELLVSEVLSCCAEGAALDIGTGSGAIALSLATEGRYAKVVATDVSEDALALARENHRALCPAAAVEFRLGSVYAPVAGERFDVIVSNPPYIGRSERPTLDPEVRDWEPDQALFAEDDGLALVREIVAGAPDHLQPNGLLAVEIGAGQGGAVLALAEAVAGLSGAEIRPDLAGRDRILIVRRAT
jgi:release factor glutamine methyltransferase